nr:helix-turn-helix transcriptional regulator [Pseudoalteromonas luteoviolacea]
MRGFEILKLARLYQGYTQEDIARLYGVSRRRYQRWEKGHVPIPYDDLTSIVKDICKLDPMKIAEVSNV